MIAYSSEGLRNRRARRAARDAEEEKSISAEEHANIRSAYPELFYTAPFFARLGFFILTCICLGFCSGFFAVLTGLDGANHFIVQTFLMAAACFAALEWLIRNKRHLASGVDDAFLYSAAGLTIGACYLVRYDMAPMSQALIILVVSMACVVRYADRLMTLTGFFALLVFVFFGALKTGSAGRALMPFLMMGINAGIYFSAAAGSRKKELWPYNAVFYVLKTASLVCLYASGNYFVVREASHQMSGNLQGPSAEIPLAWLFWMITILLPLVYILLGLRKKNRLFLLTGLILIAGTVFTIRFYHGFLAPEWALVAGGGLLLAVGYGCLRFLKVPRAGITAERQGKDPVAGFALIEALVIDETLAPATPADPQVVFGGGSGGGGGAGGQF